jgi:farnesyl-diphosphate farnesyltransferase
LNKTSRSFSAVIQELHPELLLPICLFYLILRGLDTVEDDTSIAAKTKEPVLRGFKDHLEEDGWTYDGNRPEEKDRDLLVNFHYVIEEFKKIKPEYRIIIKDITDKMGNGMADYCLNAEFNEVGVDTIKAYDLYCHYVAGLVGEGLTKLFVESTFGNATLLDQPHLSESMGLFLQKTNIIRDVREDTDDGRKFWPREIWSKHVEHWDDLFQPEHREAALNCSSEMVLNALHHADECLFYLANLREQSVFNFAAIPQSMAIATLELCFRNPQIFERNVKITKGHACQLMIESTQNVQLVCGVFKRHVRAIRKKNTPKDPNFLKISIACGKVEQFIESIFPSQTPEAAMARQRAAEAAQREKEDAASVFYLSLAALGTLFLVTAMMVRSWILAVLTRLRANEMVVARRCVAPWRQIRSRVGSAEAGQFQRAERRFSGRENGQQVRPWRALIRLFQHGPFAAAGLVFIVCIAGCCQRRCTSRTKMNLDPCLELKL